MDRPWIEACDVHPFELAVSGFSGAGKTTLLERLVPRLAPLRIGFLKSDAHRVSMDREGKDTFRLAAAGVADVAIRSEALSAQLTAGPIELREWKSRLSENDVVLLEGFRDSSVPKLLVLDEAGEAWKELGEGRYRGVEALVHSGEALHADLPMFHRDDLDGIANFVQQLWASRVPRVRGLVLSGGRSRRMGSDKATLDYHGRSQARWLMEMMEAMGLDPLLSRAVGQESPAKIAPDAVLTDRFVGYGPLGGILTAMESDSASAWMVVGCDLPLLRRETLDALLEARDPYRNATAYLDSDHRFPEPMCSLWEPKSRSRAFQFLGLGYRCPRKVLINSRVSLLSPPGSQILFNANTPAQRETAVRAIAEASS